MRIFFWTIIVLLFATYPSVHAQINQPLSHIPNEEELVRWNEIGSDFVPTAAPVAPIRNIAEFEPTEAVLVRYPFGLPVALIKEIADDCHVITLVANASQENTVRAQYQSNGVNLSHCDFIYAPTDSYWTRDYGPWFIVDGNNEVGIINFTYNRPRPNDNQVPVHVAGHLGISYYNMGLSTTGGNWMCDGLGNAASTDLVWEENPSMSHDDIAAMVEEYLGIETYHVLNDPLGDYIKHIDCWGKFLAPDKVMIGQVPVSDPRYNDFESAAAYFENIDSPYGLPYRVYRVYTPGGYPATPYTNGLILNRKVFLPQSGSQWDDEAMAAYQEAMPGYEIIGVAYSGWENTDALHCRTHEVADREMLYLKHLPLLSEIPPQEEYELSMAITSYGNYSLVADSVYAVFRINEAVWDTLVMTAVSKSNTYRVTLPGVVPGSKVEYFLHAADVSGRSEEHPYIGAYDPHTFFIQEEEFAQLVVSVDTIRLACQPGLTDITLLSLGNTGQQTLTFTTGITGDQGAPVDWLNLSPDNGSIAEGESLEIELTANALALPTGVYYAALTIYSNDPLHPEVVVPVVFRVSDEVGLDVHNTIDEYLCYPNPTQDKINISFILNTPGLVKISVFDRFGKQVIPPFSADFDAGRQKFLFNVGNLPSGVYFYIMNSGFCTISGRFVLSH
ncbi:MAG TPA: agmatine deiminase family protein [Bacteroidales bacterium]|nr:agmatine deiminase family protein [Bacteroidales bacterium]